MERLTKEERYDELARKLKNQHECFKKHQRKIMNEPESKEKYAKLELMDFVIDRSREIVNWWYNYDAKIQRKEKHRAEMARAEERKRKKEMSRKKVDKILAEAIKSQTQNWNTGCRYYCQSGEERSCSCGMDMIYCSKNCAFATNMAGSTVAYEAPVTVNHKIVGRK